MKIATIPRLDCTDIKPPWGETINSIQTSTIVLATPDPGSLSGILSAEGMFNIALHWVYKLKWNPDYKIPLSSRKMIALTKPYGQHLFSIMNLCTEFYLLAEFRFSGHPLLAQYPSSARWFALICQEIKENQIMQAVSPNASKTEIIKAMRRELALLKDEKNPYNQATEPHLWRLIETGLDLKIREPDAAPGIIRKYWTGMKNSDCLGFIQAYSRLIAIQEEMPNYVATRIIDGKIYEIGKGKSRKDRTLNFDVKS